MHMNLANYTPQSGQQTNKEIAEQIASMIDGDLIDALDAMLAYIQDAGWTWEKPEGFFGAVVDSNGNRHILWSAQSFADAVTQAFRLLKQYEKMGWAQ